MDTTGSQPSWRVRGRGAISGLIATAVALGVAELVRAMNRQMSSPVIDVGARFIDATPRWLKDFAIDTFGTNDKIALIVGIGVFLVAFAVVVGLVAVRRPWVGVAGIALFGAIGCVASASVGPWWSALPSFVGALAGAAALLALIRVAAAAPAGASVESPLVTDGEPVVAGPGRPAIAGLSDAERTAAAVATGDEAPQPDQESGLVGALGRRSFLALGAGLTGAAVVAAGTGRWLSNRFDVAAERARIMLPKAIRPLPKVPVGATLNDVPGITPFVTKNSDFYRIDTALVAPQVPVDTWTLKVTGMVDEPFELSYEELLDMDLIESDITLSCVSNEIGGTLAGNARWLGLPLTELLGRAGVSPDADQIVGRSTDGFTAGFPVQFGTEADRDALVAVGMNGEPLPVIHGFPARLVVPGLYGYVSATKWLTEIELTRFDRFDAYWAEREWSVDGPIKTFSRIDTPGPLATVTAGPGQIAGVAWAQTRGIERVQVRVNGGEWMDARLADELNDMTWRQWVLPFEFTGSGRVNVECRATDGTGAIQTEKRSEPFPDGASGWHSVIALVQ